MRRLLLALMLIWLAALVRPALAADTVYYYYTNTLHSAVVETDAQGNIVEQTTYYAPYGQVLNRSMRDGPGYTGHEEDPSTGLNYMQQRYYDPQSGRFVSTDPVVPTDDGENFNRYWYANDNPYRYTDPDGRSVSCDASSCTIEAHSLLEEAADYVYVGAKYAQRLIQIKLAEHSRPTPSHNESHPESPALPKGLVGVQDAKSGQRGGKHRSGPLAPEHGGTGDSEKDFGKLTGGVSGPASAEKDYPAGTQVGANGIAHRPADADAGPRIDIPANGSKPHETLHYPKPPPPPTGDGGNS